MHKICASFKHLFASPIARHFLDLLSKASYRFSGITLSARNASGESLDLHAALRNKLDASNWTYLDCDFLHAMLSAVEQKCVFVSATAPESFSASSFSRSHHSAAFSSFPTLPRIQLHHQMHHQESRFLRLQQFLLRRIKQVFAANQLFKRGSSRSRNHNSHPHTHTHTQQHAFCSANHVRARLMMKPVCAASPPPMTSSSSSTDSAATPLDKVFSQCAHFNRTISFNAIDAREYPEFASKFTNGIAQSAAPHTQHTLVFVDWANQAHLTWHPTHKQPISVDSIAEFIERSIRSNLTKVRKGEDYSEERHANSSSNSSASPPAHAISPINLSDLARFAAQQEEGEGEEGEDDCVTHYLVVYFHTPSCGQCAHLLPRVLRLATFFAQQTPLNSSFAAASSSSRNTSVQIRFASLDLSRNDVTLQWLPASVPSLLILEKAAALPEELRHHRQRCQQGHAITNSWSLNAQVLHHKSYVDLIRFVWDHSYGAQSHATQSHATQSHATQSHTQKQCSAQCLETARRSVTHYLDAIAQRLAYLERRKRFERASLESLRRHLASRICPRVRLPLHLPPPRTVYWRGFIWSSDDVMWLRAARLRLAVLPRLEYFARFFAEHARLRHKYSAMQRQLSGIRAFLDKVASSSATSSHKSDSTYKSASQSFTFDELASLFIDFSKSV